MAKSEIELSGEEIANFIISNKATIRQAANYFGCSKSVIWSRLKKYDGSLRERLDEILNSNKKSTYSNLKNNRG